MDQLDLCEKWGCTLSKLRNENWKDMKLGMNYYRWKRQAKMAAQELS